LADVCPTVAFQSGTKMVTSALRLTACLLSSDRNHILT